MVLTDGAGARAGERATGHVPPERVAPPTLESPRAHRLRPARWLHPQVVVGAILVLTSVVVGARLVGGGADAAPVLVAAGDLAPGQPLTADLVVEQPAELQDAGDLYLTGAVGEGYVLTRPVARGEFVPRSAVAPAAELVSGTDALRFVTLSLPAAEIPAGLAAGDVVDVWRVGPEGSPEGSPEGGDQAGAAGAQSAATLVAPGVRVTAVASAAGTLAVDGSPSGVTLAVAAADTAPKNRAGSPLEALVGTLVAACRDGRVYLTMQPAGATGSAGAGAPAAGTG